MIHHIPLSRIFILLLIALLVMLAPSCADRQFEGLPDYTVSGQPVTVKVPLLMPQMDEKTRGSLSENQLNRVESLWIRTYNAETGLATSNWIKCTPNTSDLHNMRSVDIETQSGYTYIVAVANVSAMGVTSDDINEEKPLSELLENAATWADFLKIAVVSPSDQDDVNAPQGNLLPMAGCYTDATEVHVAFDQWQTKDFQPYFIPASTDKIEFKGGIHLRRLVSHITFNFKSGNDNLDLEVNSYQIVNAPKFSWLYERSAEQTTAPNFGDLATSAENATDYYADVPQFGSQFIRNVDGVQSFDFWQAENKQTGTCTTYADRGAKTEKDGITLFTSLTGETWTPANEASYVVVDCTMEYKNPINVDQDGTQVTEGGEIVRRSGNATYFIHLGYIMGDSPEAKSMDFNCFRNVDYTYNVTVNGLDDIRVDAIAEDETYHNEEGLVVDLQDKPIEIDAHYAVFNIQITEQELQENFGFIITTYDNGEQITISEKNPRADVNGSIVIYEDDAKTKPIDPKYYNWIELRPTVHKDSLALYKPRFAPNADKKTFLLTDLYNIKDENGNNILNLPAKSDSGYYTVFVNEYTYEPMYGEEGYGNESNTMLHGKPAWMSYVNQNPRRFYIKVSYRESPDGNSVYARSKYAVEQQSLMTYYSQINVDKEGTAIGVERENETLGLNLRHHNKGGGSSLTNGRWNIAQYLTTGEYPHNNLTESYNPATERPWGAISVNRPIEKDKSSWDHFLDMSDALEVAGVSDLLRLQGGPPIQARTVANGNPHKLRRIKKESGSTAPNFTDPQTDSKYNIPALATCIIRNRDNNGNGKIDAEELRWYIPAMTRYIGMTLGENAMPQRLMTFENITQLPYVTFSNNKGTGFSSTPGSIDNRYYSRYMYLASNYAENSDNNVLWALEGTSMSRYNQLTEWAKQDMNPWEIRCIRNLGSDLRTVIKDDKVSIPYKHTEGNRTLTMDYFNLAAIRTYKLTGNNLDNPDCMPIHTINSPYNSVYSAFEYANEDIWVPDNYKPNESQYQDHYFDLFRDYIRTNPCGNAGFSGTGWRVPNQIELTMMFNEKVLVGNGNWLSCTVEYIDRKDGKGSDTIAHKLYLGSNSQKTLLLSWDNYAGFDLRVRCVRDINP